VRAQPVVGIGEVQGRQPFDALDAVGDGVDVDAEYPGGLLEALVLVQVDRQSAEEVHLVPGVVVDQGTEHILSELPQLMHVAYLQQKPVDAEFGVTDGLPGTPDADTQVDGVLGLEQGLRCQFWPFGGFAQPEGELISCGLRREEQGDAAHRDGPGVRSAVRRAVIQLLR
jgi:hypothetical protein